MRRATTLFPAFALLATASAAIPAQGQVIYNSASTAAESYADGVSNVIQSRGQANLSNSQAAINLQDAYSMGIDNSIKSVNAFWAKKDIYNQRLAQQNYETAQKRDAYLAKHGLQSLTPAEFDRTTGQIAWPKVLDQAQYDKYRKTLDELLRKRAYQGALTSDDYITATTMSKEWRDLLASQKKDYPAPILSQMIRFVLKVNRELDDNLS